MHAAFKILVDEAGFSHQVSAAVVHAMDVVVKDSQFVTTPVLDARLSELRSDIDTRFAEIGAEMNARFAEVRAEMRMGLETLESRVEARFARLKTELLLWILVIVVGNNYLPQMISTLMDAVSQAIRSFQ